MVKCIESISSKEINSHNISILTRIIIEQCGYLKLLYILYIYEQVQNIEHDPVFRSWLH